MRERRAWSRFCLREISTFSRVFAPIVVLVSAERAAVRGWGVGNHCFEWQSGEKESISYILS